MNIILYIPLVEGKTNSRVTCSCYDGKRIGVKPSVIICFTWNPLSACVGRGGELA